MGLQSLELTKKKNVFKLSKLVELFYEQGSSIFEIYSRQMEYKFSILGDYTFIFEEV